MDQITPHLNTFQVALGSSDFKDKLGRLIQYSCRGVSGFISDFGIDAKDTVYQLTSIQGSLSEASRLAHFFKEWAVAPTIMTDLEETDPFTRNCKIVSKVSLVLFYLLDHASLLQKWKVIGGGSPRNTLKFALKLFTLAHAANLVLQLKKLREELELEGTAKYDQRKRDAAALNATKAALLVFQGLHISDLLKTRDSLVGLAGVASSLLELQALWPNKPKAS
jgi:hypothetical protein